MGAMGGPQKNVQVKVTVPGRAAPCEYILGQDVRARDLFMMLQDDLGATPTNQRLFLKVSHGAFVANYAWQAIQFELLL